MSGLGDVDVPDGRDRPRAVALLARAIELLRARERADELEQLVLVELPAACAVRLVGRRLAAAGSLTESGAEIAFTGPDLAGGRLVMTIAATGARVRLELGGHPLPAPLEGLPLKLDYPAGQLPNDHGLWSDIGGLLMVGELTASSGG